MTVDLVNALPPAAENEALTSASLAQVEPFNEAVRHAFHLMLNARKNESRERMTASEKERGIRWLTEFIPERLDQLHAMGGPIRIILLTVLISQQ